MFDDRPEGLSSWLIRLQTRDEPRLLHTVRGVGYVLRKHKEAVSSRSRPQPDRLAPLGHRHGAAVRDKSKDADKPSMTVTKAWPLPFLTAVVPSGLPSGAITLIELGRAGVRSNDFEFAQEVRSWDVGVLQVIDALHGQQRPVLYVSCGATEKHAARGVAGKFGSDLVRGFDDEDLTVVAPSTHITITGSRAAAYDCHVPTLERLGSTLDALQAKHGPAAVILDDISSARPYWAACEDEESLRLPDDFRLERFEADAWRADQVVEFAGSRPKAPTVVVWHTRGDDAGLDALRALACVRLVLTEDVPGRVAVGACDRSTVLGTFSQVQTIVVS